MKRNRSNKKILNKSGPRIEPCGTPNNISSQELKVLSLFLHADFCLYDNYGATSKPYVCNFAIGRSLDRQSKALDKSFKSAP